MQLHAPQTQWHTIEKPSFSLKAEMFVLVTQWKMATPAWGVLQSHQHREPGRRKIKAAKRQCLPLNPFISGHACSPSLWDTSAVHWQHHWNGQQISTSETPARLSCRNPACDSAWEYIFKSKSFRHRSLGKNRNKNPAPKQAVHFKPLFLLLFIFNCTRNELFWSTILKVLEKFCQVLEKHRVILKLQSDKLLLWENNHLLNDWAGGLNLCFTQAREGTAGARSGHCSTPCRPLTSQYLNITTPVMKISRNCSAPSLLGLNLVTVLKTSRRHHSMSVSCYNTRLTPQNSIK